MKVSIVSSKQTIKALIEVLQSPSYGISNRIILVKFCDYEGYSSAELDLVGEVRDVFFLGLYTGLKKPFGQTVKTKTKVNDELKP